MLRAVIFDMDGVIVDSEPLHVKAERQTMAPYGVEVAEKEMQGYMGRTPKILLRELIKRYRLDAALETIYTSHKMNLLTLYQNEVEPIPGALGLICDLVREGKDLALASSSDNDLISVVLDKFCLSPSFNVVVSGEEVVRVKPYPDIFLEATRRLGYDSRECIVIEDSKAGVRASKSAGIPCVGFRSPHSKNQDLSEAEIIIDDLREIDTKGLEMLLDGIPWMSR